MATAKIRSSSVVVDRRSSPSTVGLAPARGSRRRARRGGRRRRGRAGRDTGRGSPRPSDSRSQIAASRLSSSTLLATSSTRLAARRTTSAARASSSVTPVSASTTNSTASASAIAFSLCRLTFSSRVSPPGSQPPVSTRVNVAPAPLGVDLLAVAGDAGALLDDRLAPADDAVDERRLADVRPADDGDDGLRLTPLQRLAQGDAVGGHDLDRPGQVLGRGAVEEAALGQADVGQQVAVALGLGGEHPGEVLPDQQPGDADVAAEEPVLDGDDPDVVAAGDRPAARAPGAP